MHPTRDSNAAAIIWRSDLTRIPVIKLLWASTIAMDCRYWINDTIWYNLSQVNWSTDLSTSHKAPVSASRPPTSMLNDKNVNASIFQDEPSIPPIPKFDHSSCVRPTGERMWWKCCGQGSTIHLIALEASQSHAMDFCLSEFEGKMRD